MEIVLYIVGALVLAVLGLLAFAATRPNTFRYERQTEIAAPPESVFPHVADFHLWNAWSPWEKLDLQMKKNHSGSSSGKGAIYEWDGNNKVGQGRMEILEAKTPEKITIQLDFFRPFKAHNTTEFQFQKTGSGTKVNWIMFGQNVFMGKVMGLFMDMDKMIGKDFEKGLASLKEVVEKK